MKYIITESQLTNYFSMYLKKFRPELFDLHNFPLKRRDKSVYGWEFEVGDTLNLIFEYKFEPEGVFASPNIDEYPILKITRRLKDEIEGMFGPNGSSLLKSWFEEYYKLPVKTIKQD